MSASRAELVAAGAGRLDELDPWWAVHVDVGSLDMSRFDRDILGQLAGTIAGVERLDPQDATLGMFIPGRENSDDVRRGYAELNELWRAEIRRRAGGMS